MHDHVGVQITGIQYSTFCSWIPVIRYLRHLHVNTITLDCEQSLFWSKTVGKNTKQAQECDCDGGATSHDLRATKCGHLPMPTLLAACGIATYMSRSHANWFSVLPLHGFLSKRGCLQCTITTLTSTASQQFLQGKHHWPAQKKLSKDIFNRQIWTSIHWYNWYSDGAVILQYWNSAYWTRGAYLQKGVLIGERALNRIINGNLL